jgi:hypothetical protein
MSDAFAEQPGPSLHIAGTKGMVEVTRKRVLLSLPRPYGLG